MSDGAAKLDFIDALRGLAILLVILVHAALAGVEAGRRFVDRLEAGQDAAPARFTPEQPRGTIKPVNE